MPNHYKKTTWVDRIRDIVTNQVISEGTRFNASRANNMEDGIYSAHDYINALQSEVQRLRVQMEIDGRVPGNSGAFYDTLDGNTNKINLDTAQTDVTEATEIGATVLKVASTEGFKNLTQVTVYDDLASEEVMITAIGDNTITVQSLSNSYKKGSKLFRSNVVVNLVEANMNIGNWSNYSVELVEVV